MDQADRVLRLALQPHLRGAQRIDPRALGRDPAAQLVAHENRIRRRRGEGRGADAAFRLLPQCGRPGQCLVLADLRLVRGAGFEQDVLERASANLRKETGKKFIPGQMDFDELAEFTTQDMFTALTHELRARGPVNSAEVVTLEAKLLGMEHDAREHLASVRFSGTMRVDGELETFDEVWNLAKPVDGSSGWLLAGIQQLN